jgi:TFIIF-interacting CTD phosphatase-like protein
MNLFLDLDNTLIYTEKGKTRPRPHLNEFLNYAFDNFNVSIWTAASQSYAKEIIHKFILTKPKRRLRYLLHDDHCKASQDYFGNIKDLRLLFQVLKLPNINLENTILIDDLSTNCKYQRKNCINVFPYKGKDKGDNELLQVIQQLKIIKSRYNNSV